MKTKSQIMKEAHQIAKTFEGNYSACFSEALKLAWAKAKDSSNYSILKNWSKKDVFVALFEKGFCRGYESGKGYTERTENQNLILSLIENKSEGFKKDIAEKAWFNRLSEKQAWVLAFEFEKLIKNVA